MRKLFHIFLDVLATAIDVQQQQQQQQYQQQQHQQMQQQQQHTHSHQQQSDIERMDPGTKSEGEEEFQHGTIKTKASLGRTPNHLTLRLVNSIEFPQFLLHYFSFISLLAQLQPFRLAVPVVRHV